MHTIIKVRWVILKDSKVFLLQWAPWKKFMLPWWKQEKNETIKDTFYREMFEETWIKAEIEKFLWFKEYINQKWEITIQFLFKVKNIYDFENIDKTKCSHWYEWIQWGFYDLDYLKENNLDYPQDLEEIINTINFDYNYNYFI